MRVVSFKSGNVYNAIAREAVIPTATRIIATAAILRDQYDGDVPSTLDGFLSLPGVGEKIALLAMLRCWDRPVGIACDVHVMRVGGRLRWALMHGGSGGDQRCQALPFWTRA